MPTAGLSVERRDTELDKAADNAACAVNRMLSPMLELLVTVRSCPTEDAKDTVADTTADRAPWTARLAETTI